MKDNIFANIPHKQEGEIFQTLLKNEKVTIERIISDGDTTPWMTQTQDEWVLILQGNAIIEMNHARHTLSVGDYLFIPSNTQHRVVQTSQKEKTLWLAFHF